MEKIIKILGAQKWIYAKTMPKNPHDYCLRKNFKSDDDFVYAVQFIRDNGIKLSWEGRSYIYLYLNGYRYWTMGCAINKPDGSHYTILINRSKYEINSLYDLIAEKYDDMFSSESFKKEDTLLFDIIRDKCNGKIVLDIGSGTGLFLDNINHNTNDYIGVDPSKNMVDIFKNKHPNNRVINDNIENLYLGQFNFICALYGTASYFNEYAYKRIMRMLSKDGKYFFMKYKNDYTPYTHKAINLDMKTYNLSFGEYFYDFGNYDIMTNFKL